MILKSFVTILLHTTKVFVVTILCTKWRFEFLSWKWQRPPKDGATNTEAC
jgi:hypothetical protein